MLRNVGACVMLMSIFTTLVIRFYDKSLRKLRIMFIKIPVCFTKNVSTVKYSQTPLQCQMSSWRVLIKPCLKDLKWNTTFKENKNLDTSVRLRVITVTLNPPGFESYIKITTVDTLNKRKSVGGDFWWVNVIGPIAFNVAMVDNMDGSYEGKFDVMLYGNFSIHTVLEYSLCDGMKDPPAWWFSNGTTQGKFQKEGILGELNYFKNESRTLNFIIKNENDESESRDFEKYQFASASINRGCGFWRKNQFNMLPEKRTEVPSYTKQNGTQWFYGDSMTKRFYDYLENRPLCKKMFSCQRTYAWIYSMDIHEQRVEGMSKYDGRDFNETHFLLEIKNLLLRKELKSKNSVLVINFGLHFIMSLTFTQCKMAFPSFLSSLKDLKNEYGSNFPLVIWKGTSVTEIESIKPYTHFRYLTKQREILWNAYTLEAVRGNNIPVLDIYYLTASYHPGTINGVHYKDRVFETAESEMEHFLLLRNEKG